VAEIEALTKDLLTQVQDTGRRLSGINGELPASMAFAEVKDCILDLEVLKWRFFGLAMREAQEKREGATDGGADAGPE